MTALTLAARETIRYWYQGDDPRITTTIAGYIRRGGWPDGKWHGDACGCPDDRCKDGYHHEPREECGCLRAELDRWVREQQAKLAGEPIWTAYRAAVEANDGKGDPQAYEQAWAEAEAWVREYQGAGVVSFSLDAVIDGRRGISIRTQFNDKDWLVWTAPGQDGARLHAV